jgi:hypothetical protein
MYQCPSHPPLKGTPSAASCLDCIQSPLRFRPQRMPNNFVPKILNPSKIHICVDLEGTWTTRSNQPKFHINLNLQPRTPTLTPNTNTEHRHNTFHAFLDHLSIIVQMLQLCVCVCVCVFVFPFYILL